MTIEKRLDKVEKSLLPIIETPKIIIRFVAAKDGGADPDVPDRIGMLQSSAPIVWLTEEDAGVL